jgi:hypothetical protein
MRAGPLLFFATPLLERLGAAALEGVVSALTAFALGRRLAAWRSRPAAPPPSELDPETHDWQAVYEWASRWSAR